MKNNLMRKAHELTKQIVSKYGDVDYKAQLSLCLSFLSQKKGEKEMVEISIGTEKQIAYAAKRRESEIQRVNTKIEKCGHMKSVAKKVPVMKAYIELLQLMDNARDILAAMEMSYEMAVKKWGKGV